MLKAKLKLRLAAERYREKDVSALAATLMSSAMRYRYGAPRSPLVLLRSAVLLATCVKDTIFIILH